MEIIDWFNEWQSCDVSPYGDRVFVAKLYSDDLFFGRPLGEHNVQYELFGIYRHNKKYLIHPLEGMINEYEGLFYMRARGSGFDDNQGARKMRKLIRQYLEEYNIQ